MPIGVRLNQSIALVIFLGAVAALLTPADAQPAPPPTHRPRPRRLRRPKVTRSRLSAA